MKALYTYIVKKINPQNLSTTTEEGLVKEIEVLFNKNPEELNLQSEFQRILDLLKKRDLLKKTIPPDFILKHLNQFKITPSEDETIFGPKGPIPIKGDSANLVAFLQLKCAILEKIMPDILLDNNIVIAGTGDFSSDDNIIAPSDFKLDIFNKLKYLLNATYNKRYTCIYFFYPSTYEDELIKHIESELYKSKILCWRYFSNDNKRKTLNLGNKTIKLTPVQTIEDAEKYLLDFKKMEYNDSNEIVREYPYDEMKNLSEEFGNNFIYTLKYFYTYNDSKWSKFQKEDYIKKQKNKDKSIRLMKNRLAECKSKYRIEEAGFRTTFLFFMARMSVIFAFGYPALMTMYSGRYDWFLILIFGLVLTNVGINRLENPERDPSTGNLLCDPLRLFFSVCHCGHKNHPGGTGKSSKEPTWWQLNSSQVKSGNIPLIALILLGASSFFTSFPSSAVKKNDYYIYLKNKIEQEKLNSEYPNTELSKEVLENLSLLKSQSNFRNTIERIGIDQLQKSCSLKNNTDCEILFLYYFSHPNYYSTETEFYAMKSCELNYEFECNVYFKLLSKKREQFYTSKQILIHDSCVKSNNNNIYVKNNCEFCSSELYGELANECLEKMSTPQN